MMGAQDFQVKQAGATAQDAFKTARAAAQFENGHSGYTGTIAEKTSFVMVRPGTDPDDMDQPAYSDKWGPAACVDNGDGSFTFFGSASC